MIIKTATATATLASDACRHGFSWSEARGEGARASLHLYESGNEWQSGERDYLARLSSDRADDSPAKWPICRYF